MKCFFYRVLFCLVSLSGASVHAMGIFDAARDTVEGAKQVAQDTLDIVREPNTVVEGAATITRDAFETTGNVVEDVLVPRNRMRVEEDEMLMEPEMPYMPEQSGHEEE